MVDIHLLAWPDVLEDIHPEVVVDEPEDERHPQFTEYPDDAIYVPVGPLRLAYIIELRYIDGASQRKAVSSSDMSRWGVNADQLQRHVAADGPMIPVDTWQRYHGHGRVYEPSEVDYDWTYVLLRPELLEALDLKGRPLLMILASDVILVTGDRDLCGRREMKRYARQLAKGCMASGPIEYWPNKPALTPQPLIHCEGAWRVYEL